VDCASRDYEIGIWGLKVHKKDEGAAKALDQVVEDGGRDREVA
jgi:hypothetical protein